MFPHAYLIEVVIALLVLGTLGLSAWNLREAWLDWRAERVMYTSKTAVVRTRGDLLVELAQLAQVCMLTWFGVRMMLVAPPETIGMFLHPEQINTGRMVFLGFVLLKALGRYLERRVRRDVRDTYTHEFTDVGRTLPAQEGR
jgi:hypothetical protein